ncbi:MAG: DUF3850 domain-containing protein [Bacteroidia bacterium]
MENGKTHYLKTVQPYFNEVWSGKKKFEFRFNDRDFKTGDTIVLQEYQPKFVESRYTGREVHAKILYILREFEGMKSDYVVLSFNHFKRFYI